MLLEPWLCVGPWLGHAGLTELAATPGQLQHVRFRRACVRTCFGILHVPYAAAHIAAQAPCGLVPSLHIKLRFTWLRVGSMHMV